MADYKKMKRRYYAYLLPDKKQGGICESWEECAKKVIGKSEARYRGFDFKKEAEEWLATGAEYTIRSKPILKPGIYFDAGTGRGKGVEISVTDENGKDLLDQILEKKKLNKYHKYPVGGVTNNYGELLAMKYTLELARRLDVKAIFGDSKLVINYWSQGAIRKAQLNSKTVRLAREVQKLRADFELAGGRVERISGADNPADLGFH